MGAFMSIFFIWGLLIWLNTEAIHRIMHPPPPINSTVMLVTAIIGFACNVTNLVALNCACGAEEEDDEDEELVDDEMGEDLNLTISNRNEIYKKKPAAPLSESLSGVYKIR